MNISEKNIWDKLKSYGFTDAGCAGIMGNCQAESGLRSNNVQNTSGKDDDAYTAAVDNGSYSRHDFTHDKQGYGLFQWTYWSRKQALYDFAKSKKVSIADAIMQLNFFVQELKADFPQVYNVLTTTDSVREASDAMLLEFERPADQTVTNQERRAKMSQTFYDKYHVDVPKEKTEVLFEGRQGDYIVKVVLIKTPAEDPKVDEEAKTTRTRTVKKGDTLSGIAKEFGTTVDAIVEENIKKYPKITRDYIDIGWELAITV